MVGFLPAMNHLVQDTPLGRLFARRWTPYALLLAITALVWGHTVRFEFVWDDLDLIQHLESIRSFENLPSMFTSLEAQSAWPEGFKLFRPVRLVACAILYQLGGNPEPVPWLFHLANVLGHGLAACLLFAVACRLFEKWFPELPATRLKVFALWTAAAYAGHPVVSEVVCWAKALDDELATVFTLAATLCLLRWTQDKQPLTGALAFYILALYSKISAAPFAIMALVLARWVHGLPWGRSMLRTSWFFAAAALFMVHRHSVIGQTSQTAPISGTYAQTLVDMLPVIPQYLKLLCGLPPFSIDYTFMKGGHAFFSLPVQAGLWLLIGGVAAAAWSSTRSHWRFLSFSLAWVGLFLLPVSNLLPMMQYMAERFLYLSLIGWLLLAAGLLIQIRRWQVGIAAGTAALCLWMLTAWDRSLLWHDNLTLFVQSSQQHPRSQRVVDNAVGAIFAQPQVGSIFRFANKARDLSILKVPEPSERAPLRQTLEAALQMFPEDPVTATALAHLEQWDGNQSHADALRALAASKQSAPKLAGEAPP